MSFHKIHQGRIRRLGRPLLHRRGGGSRARRVGLRLGRAGPRPSGRAHVVSDSGGGHPPRPDPQRRRQGKGGRGRRKTIIRILAGLAAALILVSLTLPAFAKQVNTETKEQELVYGDTDYDPEYGGNPIGRLREGDTFWSEQPFDAYWTDRGFYAMSENNSYHRSKGWIMTNYYALVLLEPLSGRGKEIHPW